VTVSDIFSSKIDPVLIFYTFRHDGGSVCNKPSPSPQRNKVAIIAISVVVPVLVVILLLLAYFIWWEKRKPNGVHPVAQFFTDMY